jgi:HPt (histidine-containing phosphotransfer) domain-containing protein
MTLKECYDTLGGGYDEVMGRLRTEERVKKFVFKFLADKSFLTLTAALEEENAEEAFRAAHTLKGVSQNLSLNRLYESSHSLTEELREGIGANAGSLFEQVKTDYEVAAAAIRALQESDAV